METDYGSGKVISISITTATMFLTVWTNCSWKLAKLGVFIKHKTPIITALGYTSRLLIKKKYLRIAIVRAVDDAWTRRTNKSITTNAQVILKVYDCWLIKERGSKYIDCSDKSEIGKRNNRLLAEWRQGLVDIKRNKQLLIKDMKTDYGSGKVVTISITTATMLLTVWRNCSWKLAKLGGIYKKAQKHKLWLP